MVLLGCFRGNCDSFWPEQVTAESTNPKKEELYKQQLAVIAHEMEYQINSESTAA